MWIELFATVLSAFAIMLSLVLFSIWMNIDKDIISELGATMPLNLIKMILIMGTAFYMSFVFNIDTIIAFVAICILDYIFGKLGYILLVHFVRKK